MHGLAAVGNDGSPSRETKPTVCPTGVRVGALADDDDLSSADNASPSCGIPMVATVVRFVAAPGDDRRRPWSTRLTSLSPCDLSRSASDTADTRAPAVGKACCPIVYGTLVPAFLFVFRFCRAADNHAFARLIPALFPGWGLNVGVMPISLTHSLRS